mgnify:CR=1 FL=1
MKTKMTTKKTFENGGQLTARGAARGVTRRGPRLAALALGLAICCFAAARDGLDKTIQHAIDGSCAPGLFPLVSVPTIIGCIGALLIVTAAIATPIAKTQQTREIWFYAMSGGAVLKILTVEIARIVH